MLVKMGVAYSSLTINSSAIPPVAEQTGVPSANVHVGIGLAAPVLRHLSERMFRQLKHRPHAA